MPFIDWERLHRYKILARETREIEGNENNENELRFKQRRQAAMREQDALPITNSSRRPDLRKPEESNDPIAHEEISNPLEDLDSVGTCRNRDSHGRLLARTTVGQVLLDAATLAMEMDTHRDRVLLQRYAHSNGDMSYRQPFLRQDPQTHRFSGDDILYRDTMPRKHLSLVRDPSALSSQHEARMLMLGDLWLWGLDDYTILTCLAPRIGEDADSDPRSLQNKIHQVLSDKLRHGLRCTIENILTVILDVCLGSMFEGLPKHPQDVDLIGLAESEIASLVRDCNFCCSYRSDILKSGL